MANSYGQFTGWVSVSDILKSEPSCTSHKPRASFQRWQVGGDLQHGKCPHAATQIYPHTLALLVLTTGELPGQSRAVDHPGHTAPGPRHCSNPSPEPGQQQTAQSSPSCGQQETWCRAATTAGQADTHPLPNTNLDMDSKYRILDRTLPALEWEKIVHQCHWDFV